MTLLKTWFLPRIAEENIYNCYTDQFIFWRMEPDAYAVVLLSMLLVFFEYLFLNTMIISILLKYCKYTWRTYILF